MAKIAYKKAAEATLCPGKSFEIVQTDHTWVQYASIISYCPVVRVCAFCRSQQFPRTPAQCSSNRSNAVSFGSYRPHPAPPTRGGNFGLLNLKDRVVPTSPTTVAHHLHFEWSIPGATRTLQTGQGVYSTIGCPPVVIWARVSLSRAASLVEMSEEP